MAEVAGAEVLLVHVAVEVRDPSPTPGPHTPRFVTHDPMYRLEMTASDLSKLGVSASAAVAFGDPASEILKLVERKGADLIAVTAHEDWWTDRSLGGVAKALVRASGRPVLVQRRVGKARLSEVERGR